jgi:tetratricopeptide (TPR) repeat protein
LHLGYALLGMDHEYFYVKRGNYLYELKCYSLALGNYRTALEKYDTKDPLIKGTIAYCYLMLGNYKESLRYYREAYRESDHLDLLIGLVCAELNNENDEKGLQLFDQLMKRENEFDAHQKQEAKDIKKKLIEDGLISNNI